MLDSANYFGFPSDYLNSKNLVQLQKEFSESSKTNELTKRIELELESTREMFRILIALNKGIVSSDSTPGFRNYVKHLPTILNNAISNGKLNEIVTHIQPGFIAYKSLISSVPNFISIQNSIAKTGENNISDSLLAQSLFYAGVLTFPEFDSAMSREASIRKFQEIHHLPVDGNLNNITLSEIKNTLKQRFSLICLNLDRMRKIYSTEDNYVFVNIPEYKLHLIENNKESEIFNVIVGNEETPTPVLSSRLEYFILNPCWTVPRSISDNEMLTKIRKDSTYLQRNGYLIVDNSENPVDMNSIDWNSKNPLGGNYWIRQTNSKDNALGAVKFLFPNKHQVYLHDTPGKHLFKKEKRAFSHGCIRLQNPQKLAQIFSDKYSSSNNKTQDIKALIDKKESKVITLSKTIEIHLAYVTCVSDEKGNIVFLKDIYNLDESELNSLFTGQSSI
jgi:murein L,D-transpeptidase YcbB/YkuD